MGLGRYLVQQFARPHGPLAGYFGWLMNRGNRRMNRAVLDALEIRLEHAVLDVGFGGGGSLAMLLTERGGQRVAGVDPSPEVVASARQRFAPAIADGRLRLERATVESLPFPDGGLDRVLSVNSLYFWPDPTAGLAEIFRVLAPGGVLGLGLRAKAEMDRVGIERLGYQALGEDDLARRLAAVGYVTVSTASHVEAGWGDFVVFLARKPAG